ncbi:MAG: thiamine pyrophosphokinase, partial [Syntrophales bacterium LBB04]|nr:thiamine pyrophosphokinase [Syntrophales bacterium LBB04]
MKKVLLVVSGGKIRDLAFFRSKLSELKPAEIICADSGAGYLRAIGVVPHVIIGDMDSLPPDMLEYFKERGSRIIRFPEGKKETDTQLALEYAFGIAPDEIYLVLKNALTYGAETRSDVKIPIDTHYRMPLNWAGTFHGSYTHIPYDVLSYFYAVIRAKNIASKYKGSGYTELHEDIYADLMEDKFVTEVNARTIADEITTAHFVSKYLDSGMKPAEIYR